MTAEPDETQDARERREFTTSLGTLMVGQLAHAIATWRLAGSARSSSALRWDDEVRAVAASTSEIGGPVAGVARATTCPCECHDRIWAHGLDRFDSVCCGQWNRLRADMQ